MKINSEYLSEFCEANGIFSKEYISDKNKYKIEYLFGVPKDNLKKVNNIGQLEEIIKKFGKIPSQADIDFDNEIWAIYQEMYLT